MIVSSGKANTGVAERQEKHERIVQGAPLLCYVSCDKITEGAGPRWRAPLARRPAAIWKRFASPVSHAPPGRVLHEADEADSSNTDVITSNAKEVPPGVTRPPPQ
ncbi:hypothetical protein EYF80_050412 [Liparis tanakae]|uniref:Uncharacterized protein n=1 Tax=Liparis tanakae TaxID=230148 RepID=A0A4Z2FG82_9TELE|nr:hypothetical protein EYF80_050412 [Liparis tanakae]